MNCTESYPKFMYGLMKHYSSVNGNFPGHSPGVDSWITDEAEIMVELCREAKRNYHRIKSMREVPENLYKTETHRTTRRARCIYCKQYIFIEIHNDGSFSTYGAGETCSKFVVMK